MAFLVGTLVLQSDERYEGELPGEVKNLIEERMKASGEGESLVAGLSREGVFGALVGVLRSGVGDDVEFEENAIRTLGRAAEKGGLSDGHKAELTAVWEKLGIAGQEERGFTGDDRLDISRLLA